MKPKPRNQVHSSRSSLRGESTASSGKPSSHRKKTFICQPVLTGASHSAEKSWLEGTVRESYTYFHASKPRGLASVASNIPAKASPRERRSPRPNTSAAPVSRISIPKEPCRLTHTRLISGSQ